MLRLAAVLAVLLLVSELAAQGACTTPAFGSPIPLAVGDSPRAVAFGDFDGDQQLDLVSTFGSPGNGFGVRLQMGNGAGAFSPGVDSSTGGDGPLYLRAADLDGDRISDLVVPNEFSDTVAVLLGDGQGGLGAPTTYPVGATPWSVAIGDLNADGAEDVVVVCADDARIDVFLGDGLGGLVLDATYPTMPQPRSAVIADLDGDGSMDVAIAGAGSSNADVRSGSGTGALGPRATVALGGAAQWLVHGDFDEDGAVDLAAALAGAIDAVSIVRRTPAGGYLPPVFAAFSTSPRSIVVADFDFDGHQDLFVVNDESFPVGILVLEGDGQGNFAASTTIPFVAGFDAAVGDLDANGTMDLVYPVLALDQVQRVFSECVPRAGSDDGLFLSSTINGAALPFLGLPGDPSKEIFEGDTLLVSFGTNENALIGAPACVSYEVGTSGPVPAPFALFPFLHIDPANSYVAAVGQVGRVPWNLSAAVPPGLTGKSILVQGYALAPTVVANGLFAATGAHELRVVAAP